MRELPSVRRRDEIAAYEASQGGTAWTNIEWDGTKAEIERYVEQLTCATDLCENTADVERGRLLLPGHPMHEQIVVRGVRLCADCKARRDQRQAALDAQVAESNAEQEKLLAVFRPGQVDVSNYVPDLPVPYAALPPDYREATWEWVQEQQPRHARLLDDWATDPDSLYLFGGSGAGKSMAAGAIVKRRLDIHPQATVAWRNVSIMLDRIRRSINRPERTESLIEEAIEADILVLDDLGAETTTKWLIDRLYVVIEARIEQQRVTVITSNYSISELRQHLIDVKERPRNQPPRVGADGKPIRSPEEIAADRLISRIRGKHRVLVPFTGRDQRIHGTTTPGDTHA